MGGRGSGSSMSGGSRTSGGGVSPTSTGGKIVQQTSDQWYGENDNGAYVVINNAGKSDYNFYKYGNKQIYEVDRGEPTANIYADKPPRLYAFTKSEAMNLAKGWLKANKR